VDVSAVKSERIPRLGGLLFLQTTAFSGYLNSDTTNR